MLVVKNPPADTGDIRDMVLIPELQRSPGEGNGNPLEYSCLREVHGQKSWWAMVHRVAKSRDLRNLACMDEKLRLTASLSQTPLA